MPTGGIVLCWLQNSKIQVQEFIFSQGGDGDEVDNKESILDSLTWDCFWFRCSRHMMVEVINWWAIVFSWAENGPIGKVLTLRYGKTIVTDSDTFAALTVGIGEGLNNFGSLLERDSSVLHDLVDHTDRMVW